MKTKTPLKKMPSFCPVCEKNFATRYAVCFSCFKKARDGVKQMLRISSTSSVLGAEMRQAIETLRRDIEANNPKIQVWSMRVCSTSEADLVFYEAKIRGIDCWTIPETSKVVQLRCTWDDYVSVRNTSLEKMEVEIEA